MPALIDAAGSVASSSAPLPFIVYLIIGVAVGSFLGRWKPWSQWAICLSLIGVCGAWIGSECAYLFRWVEPGDASQLLGAAIGAAALAYSWRRLHPADPREGEDIAIHRWHA